MSVQHCLVSRRAFSSTACSLHNFFPKVCLCSPLCSNPSPLPCRWQFAVWALYLVSASWIIFFPLNQFVVEFSLIFVLHSEKIYNIFPLFFIISKSESPLMASFTMRLRVWVQQQIWVQPVILIPATMFDALSPTIAANLFVILRPFEAQLWYALWCVPCLTSLLQKPYFLALTS